MWTRPPSDEPSPLVQARRLFSVGLSVEPGSSESPGDASPDPVTNPRRAGCFSVTSLRRTSSCSRTLRQLGVCRLKFLHGEEPERAVTGCHEEEQEEHEEQEEQGEAVTSSQTSRLSGFRLVCMGGGEEHLWLSLATPRGHHGTLQLPVILLHLCVC